MTAEAPPAWNVFKQIFTEHWDGFTRVYPRYDTRYYTGLVDKMLGCGNPDQMGSIEYRCLHCGEGTHRVAMSCKSSLCLRCAKVYVDNWVSQVSQVLHVGVIYRQQFPLMTQSPQTSAARRAFGAVRLSISLCYRCFCRHRGSIVSWKKTWGRARGALTPRRGHLVRDWRGKCTGKRESRGIDRKDGGGTLQAVEQGFEQLTHRLQGVGVKQRAHALP